LVAGASRCGARASGRQVDEAIDLLGSVPEVGRRVVSRRFRSLRRLTITAGYNFLYKVDRERREVRVVAFRHGRRQPLP
jgi:plasmid stabilization system protein ParE